MLINLEISRKLSIFGNMDIRIQHTKIIKKSDVPHFYQKMPLDIFVGPFSRNLTSLLAVCVSYRTTLKLQLH